MGGVSGIGSAEGDWTGPRPSDDEARNALRQLRELAVSTRERSEPGAFVSWSRAEAHARFERFAGAAERLGVHSLRSIAARPPDAGMARGESWLELRQRDATQGAAAAIAIERVVLFVLRALEHAESPLDRWGGCTLAEIEATRSLMRLPAHIEARVERATDDARALLSETERAVAFRELATLQQSVQEARARAETEHARAIAVVLQRVDAARAQREALPDIAPAARRPELTQRDVERAIDAYLASLDAWRAAQAQGETRLEQVREQLRELALVSAPLSAQTADMRDDGFRRAALRSHELLEELSAPPVPGSPMAALASLQSACE